MIARLGLVVCALVFAACTGTSSGAVISPTSAGPDPSPTAAQSIPAQSIPPQSTPPQSTPPPSSSTSNATGRRWAHVVVVVLENRDSGSILGSAEAPYLNSLAASGMNFTDAHAETHPSQPNYLALFSGSTQGLTNDSCPHTFRGDNLGQQLLSAGYTFVGYSEHLPASGYTGCNAYPYARRHNPWVNFTNLPASVNQPLSAFPSNYDALPDVSFVIPDVLNDMHDGSIARGDAWMRAHLDGYATWARTHHSLLLVTWDEDEGHAPDGVNHIATFAVGQGVGQGTWDARVDHYTMLRAIEDAFGLPLLGKAKDATPLPPIG